MMGDARDRQIFNGILADGSRVILENTSWTRESGGREMKRFTLGIRDEIDGVAVVSLTEAEARALVGMIQEALA